MSGDKHKKRKIKRSLRLEIFAAMFAGAVTLLVMSGVVVLVLYPYTILTGLKKDTDSDMEYTLSLVDKDYLADLYKRTEEIYYGLPDDIQSDPFKADFTDNFEILTKEEGYIAIREVLDKCREVNGLGTIAFCFFDEEKERIVFVVDGDREEYMYRPGQWISEDNGSIDSLKKINRIKNSKWFMSLNHAELSGWTVTNYADVTDNGGDVIGLAYTDMDVDVLLQRIVMFTIAFLIMMNIAVGVMIRGLSRFLKFRIITPVTTLSKTAVEYTARDKTMMEEEEGVFKKIDLRTGDEIEDLWASLSDMEEDINDTLKRIRKMTSEQERMITELSIAQRIQKDILPQKFPPFPERKDFALYAQMTPARNVAGDFYDFFMKDDDHLTLVIADVSDKGVPAALFMMTARTLIKNLSLTYGQPSEIMGHVNSQLCEGNESGLFVTVWMAVIELSSGRGTVVNAGHMHPAICRADGEYALVEYEHSLPLGVLEDAEFSQHDVSLSAGDRIFVYTDGVTDATSREDEMFGIDRMLDALNKEKKDTPEEAIGSVMDAIREFTVEEDQTDDITTLSFYYLG